MKITNPLGKKGENVAAHFLTKKGYRIIEMNYRKNYAEIDVIAVKDDTVVFFEVKTRYSDANGKPFEAITKEKIRNLIITAQIYSSFNPNLAQSFRIDAIGIVVGENGQIDEIEHVENIGGF